jgi:bacteriorhodopsin
MYVQCVQAYLIMATTDTTIGSYCDGRTFEWIRYAAWAMVAPLTTSLLASIARVHVADVVVTGLAASISIAALFAGTLTPSCTGAWPLLAFAIAAGFVVVIQFVRSYRAAAFAHLPEDVANLFCFYVRSLAFTMVGYALVWGVSEGGRVANESQEIIAYTVLDIVTKVLVNVILLLGIDSYHKFGTSFAWLGGQNLDFELTRAQA